jgi:dipeptidyl aminopeptidase/acylaminoacyl peptidase
VKPLITDLLDWGGKRRDQSADAAVSKRTLALAFPPGQGEGKKPEEVAAALTAISPARLVKPNLPPYLTIHGDADPMVPLQQSQRMVEALKAKGDSAELIVKPGGAHPWPTLPEEVAVMTDWFVKHLISK